MAIDTRDKRASALDLALPWRARWPNPDGSVNQGDRQQIASYYRGISAFLQAQLLATVETGAAYLFRAVLHLTPDATGGHQYALAGTCTATTIIAEVLSTNNSTKALVLSSRLTALSSATGEASSGATNVSTTIEGGLLVNTGGVLHVQVAEQSGLHQITVKAGSSFTVTKVSS